MPSELTGKGPHKTVSIERVGGATGEHECPSGRVELGSYERYYFGLVEFATCEPGYVACIGIGEHPGMDTGEEAQRLVGGEHVFGGIGTVRHFACDGDGDALQDAEGARLTAEHVKFAVIDEEERAYEFVDALLKFVERLAVDVILDFGNA